MTKIQIGDKFGRLTVTSEEFREFATPTSKKKATFVNAQCECGNTKRYNRAALLLGFMKSCGCYRKEWAAEKVFKHGLSKTLLQSLHASIKSRCYNPNNQDYHNYGGRGIIVCPEWRDDVKAFCDWAENNGHQKGLKIDRIDCDGNYQPDNCRFVNDVISGRNRRSTKLNEEKVIQIKSMLGTHSHEEIGNKFGVNRKTIYAIAKGRTWK